MLKMLVKFDRKFNKRPVYRMAFISKIILDCQKICNNFWSI